MISAPNSKYKHEAILTKNVTIISKFPGLRSKRFRGVFCFPYFECARNEARANFVPISAQSNGEKRCLVPRPLSVFHLGQSVSGQEKGVQGLGNEKRTNGTLAVTARSFQEGDNSVLRRI